MTIDFNKYSEIVRMIKALDYNFDEVKIIKAEEKKEIFYLVRCEVKKLNRIRLINKMTVMCQKAAVVFFRPEQGNEKICSCYILKIVL